MSDEKGSTERAKELLVYGPLGFAQFLRMFVARGRNAPISTTRGMTAMTILFFDERSPSVHAATSPTSTL